MDTRQHRHPVVVGLVVVPVLTLVVALGGCATSVPVPANPRPAAEVRPAFPVELTRERRWLESWFRDTPVVITQDADELIVKVPREFCFDAASSRVKPALAAVLDKVAESLRRTPKSRLSLLATPDDKLPVTALADERAAQLQKYLRQRGVRGPQLGPRAAPGASEVQLRIGLEPPH